MAESNGTNELLSKATAVMEAIDKVIPNPEQRAKKVWDILQQHKDEVSVWDVTCFAAEYLGVQVAVLQNFEELIKPVILYIYGAHYKCPEMIDDNYAKRVAENSNGSAPTSGT